MKTEYIRIKQKGIKQVIKICLTMVAIGVFTQFFASYVLTMILDLMPDVAETYKNDISAILEITPRILIWVCIVAPICEELFFRGLVFHLMSKILPFVFANVIQALVFGIYHGNMVQGVYAFILGIFIGYLLYISGSLIYTIILHMSINLSGMFIDRIVPEDCSFIIKTIIGVISFAVIVLLIRILNRVSKTASNNS